MQVPTSHHLPARAGEQEGVEGREALCEALRADGGRTQGQCAGCPSAPAAPGPGVQKQVGQSRGGGGRGPASNHSLGKGSRGGSRASGKLSPSESEGRGGEGSPVLSLKLRRPQGRLTGRNTPQAFISMAWRCPPAEELPQTPGNQPHAAGSRAEARGRPGGRPLRNGAWPVTGWREPIAMSTMRTSLRPLPAPPPPPILLV